MASDLTTTAAAATTLDDRILIEGGDDASAPDALERAPRRDRPASTTKPAARRPAASPESPEPAAPASRPAGVITVSRRLAHPAELYTPAAAMPEGRDAGIGRRLVALLALLLLAVAVLVLVSAGGPAIATTNGDARYLSGQLAVADQRVRADLVRVRDEGTARALARTRDAILTTRSLAVELRARRGPQVARLRQALRSEGAWLQAVGSILSNPRSPLRARLLTLDGEARRAIAALPAAPAHRTGGARSLIVYARSREQATLAATQR